jgi:hypothetical protein
MQLKIVSRISRILFVFVFFAVTGRPQGLVARFATGRMIRAGRTGHGPCVGAER